MLSSGVQVGKCGFLARGRRRNGIRTHFLPLGSDGDGGDEDYGDDSRGTATKNREPFKLTVQTICVEREDDDASSPVSWSSTAWMVRCRRSGSGGSSVLSLSLLCLWSCRALYVFRFGYNADGATSSRSGTRGREIAAEGRILSISEPLETYLLSLPDVTVPSVRPAPQSWHPGNGRGGIMNRLGALAALGDQSGGGGLDGGGQV